MGVFLILVILIAGFIYCHQHPLLYFKLHRYEGQYLYLQAAQGGIWCFFLAIALNGLFYLATPNDNSCYYQINHIEVFANLIKTTLPSLDSHKLYAWVLSISLTTLLMPYVWCRLLYFGFRYRLNLKSNDDVKVVAMSQLFRDSPLDSLLYESNVKGVELMLILSDGKVYTGRVLTMGEPNENEGADQEIVFMPNKSGYRDKNCLKVNFTTDYKSVGKFEMIIRQDLIVSARRYKEGVYDSFQQVQSKVK